jgi:hypothetical protein
MDILATPPLPGNAESNQQLADEITLLAGQSNVADYRLLKLIAKFDVRKAWLGAGTIRSCAHWLNWQCGIALGAAREKVRAANCLESLPLIDASFATGEISYSKVRAMSRIATPKNEGFLLMIAQHGTASHLEQVVRKYRNVKCTNEDKAEREQELDRELVYYQDDDGSWVIHARLPAEAGSLVVKAIEAVAVSELEEEQEEKEEDVSAETLLAVEDTDKHRKSYRQARADALARITEHFLATCGQTGPWQGLKGSERCQIMLHVDIDTLREHSRQDRKEQARCDLDDKHWISAKTAKRLSCDASLVTVLENNRGKVLNIGRRARTVPPSIKRALDLRDTTCRVPGCCQSRYLDAHHIQHWADGGETSLDNLVHLCRHHHRQLHQGLFTIHVEKADALNEAQVVFSTPAGQRIEASIFPQFTRQSVESASQALCDTASTVNSKTCITHWSGEGCDYQMAMDVLLQRDGKLDSSPANSSH